MTPSPGDSDHPGPDSGNGGPDWVASVVNAVGQSKYWNNCAIFIMWDDWGGWYDHVSPPQLADVQTGAYEGLGFRTPLIVVSPYVKTHYISHQRYELVSSMSFIEKVFALGNLGLADARAQAFDDFFNEVARSGAVPADHAEPLRRTLVRDASGKRHRRRRVTRFFVLRLRLS